MQSNHVTSDRRCRSLFTKTDADMLTNSGGRLLYSTAARYTNCLFPATEPRMRGRLSRWSCRVLRRWSWRSALHTLQGHHLGHRLGHGWITAWVTGLVIGWVTGRVTAWVTGQVSGWVTGRCFGAPRPLTFALRGVFEHPPAVFRG